MAGGELVTTVLTASGSSYTIREDANGRFWLSADNVPNVNSCRIEGEWEIQRPTPWPPLLEHTLWMDSVYAYGEGDGLRIPGGGKRTNFVQEIMEGEVHG